MSFFLTEQQIRFFRSSGYFKLEHKIAEMDIFDMKQKISSYIENPQSPFKKDEKGKVYRIDNIYQRDEIFQQIITSDKILDPLESLLGPNIIFTMNRHNHATININTNKRLHRDILQWSRSLVTVILYLEDSHIENGCTEIIPTTQYLPFVGTPNNGGTWMDEHSVYKDLLKQTLPIEMQAGSLLLIDSLTFHTVGINNSKKSRMSIALGYHSVDELATSDDKFKKIVRGENLYRGNIPFEM